MGTQLGYLKGKLGLKGKTKPGEMITRMNALKEKKADKKESKTHEKSESKSFEKKEKKGLIKDKADKKNKLTIKKII